eukprot:358908-Chlamydomonas_euryale.AAC.3
MAAAHEAFQQLATLPYVPANIGAQLLGSAFGMKSAEELPNGARSEWLPGKAAEIFGCAWDVRLSAGMAV